MFPNNLADEHHCFDGVELVTLEPSGGAAVADVPALRQALRAADALAFSALNLLPDDIVWHLWSSGLGGVVPAIDDIITDSAGASWRILCVAPATFATRHKAICRNT